MSSEFEIDEDGISGSDDEIVKATGVMTGAQISVEWQTYVHLHFIISHEWSNMCQDMTKHKYTSLNDHTGMDREKFISASLSHRNGQK